MLEIIIYSAIIGIIGGGCIAAGAARMFHAPEIQSMGAFRTLGELNACNGDPISHFSFGSLPDIPIMIMCIVFTLIFARVAALFANKAKPETLNRATGAVLVILGAAILVFNLIK